jgi:hypothetical protein
MAVKLTWKPNAVLDMALAQVTTGMTRAAKFAADDAKRRARGKRIKESIKYRVITDGRTITGYVYTDWFVTRFHEMGTSKLAARPAMRPAVLENGATITRLIGKG